MPLNISSFLQYSVSFLARGLSQVCISYIWMNSSFLMGFNKSTTNFCNIVCLIVINVVVKIKVYSGTKER